MKYVKETHQMSPGHPSNISRAPIKYHQDTHQIFQDTHQKLEDIYYLSPGHPLYIFRKLIKYVQETHQISSGNP